MARPPKNVEVRALAVKIPADLKVRLDSHVGSGLQNETVAAALTEYLDREQDGAAQVLRVRIDESTRIRLARYCRDEHHGAPAENVARDALTWLLRVRDESQSEHFVVKLTSELLIKRFQIYRQTSEWSPSRVAEKALDFYLSDRENHNAEYRAMLPKARSPRRGRG